MEYFHLVKDIQWLTATNDFFVSIFGWLGNGINYGWFFCTMGLYLASQKQNVPVKQRKISHHLICLGVFLIALVIECTLIRNFDFGISYGAMLMLIPVTYYLMQVILQLPDVITQSSCADTLRSQDWKHTAKHLQDLSLLIFPLHYGIMELLEYILRDVKWYMSSTTLQYFTVIVITCTISSIILYLGKRIRFFRLFYGKF